MKTELFKIYDACSQGFGEKNDCTVKCLAIATGLLYNDAHRELEKAGRRRGRCFSIQKTIETICQFGYKVSDVTNYAHVSQIKTVRTLERNLPQKGTFIITVSKGRHILAAKDGRVHDWTVGRCHRIERIWKVDQ